MRYKKNLCMILGGLILCGWFACGKMDATYEDFVKNGETIYPGKADSLITFSGKKRIAVSWLILTDPNITSCKVFWNNGKDSTKVQVNGKGQFERVNLLIDPVTEGTYTFDVFTYDTLGNKSIKTTTQGVVYGDQYQASLLQRALSSTKWLKDTGTIVWFAGESQIQALEVKYTDKLGAVSEIRVPAWQDTLKLPRYNKGATFEYRTIYKPVPTSIDSFYTQFTTVTIN